LPGSIMRQTRGLPSTMQVPPGMRQTIWSGTKKRGWYGRDTGLADVQLVRCYLPRLWSGSGRTDGMAAADGGGAGQPGRQQRRSAQAAARPSICPGTGISSALDLDDSCRRPGHCHAGRLCSCQLPDWLGCQERNQPRVVRAGRPIFAGRCAFCRSKTTSRPLSPANASSSRTQRARQRMRTCATLARPS
jgi:hypothetical protein